MNIRTRVAKLEKIASIENNPNYHSPENVTVDELLSGACFRTPHKWTLEDLIAPGNNSTNG